MAIGQPMFGRQMGQPMRQPQMPQAQGEMLYPIGIPSLDAILGGGLPQTCNLLLYGEPMCGKKPLLMQFVYEGLRMNIPGIFVLTDYGYEDWKRMMYASGWLLEYFERSNLIEVIDCYSKQYDPHLQDAGFLSYVDSPSALSQISLCITRSQERLAAYSPMHRLAFHSLSTIIEDAGTQIASDFVQTIAGKCRHHGAMAMFALEKGMHDQKDVSAMEHLMDGAMEFDENRISIRGLLAASRGWHNFEVTQQGIIIGR
ncbi:Circadian clock protein kinase KaiC [Candidatus Anstonella stagnisolia]|nr:Circadian clock protein kinase KaiC [Candidatus Anstonella stagnisolia]